MSIDSRKAINTLRTSIKNIIYVLQANLEIDDTDTGSEIKASVKTKSSAFKSAKELIGELQKLETDNSQQVNLDWYKETITELIEAADTATNELTKVMKQKVDTNSSSTSINQSIASKPEAYGYIKDIMDGVRELQTMLDGINKGEGLKIIGDTDYKSGFAERYAYDGTLFYRPKKRKIQPGYNKELDAIVISYDGTVGEIIDCYGLRIALPKAPARASFPNARQKDHLTYWERPKLPSGLTKDTSHLFLDVIDQEFTRRDEGYWFLNNGKPEYITGPHYMLLTHFKTDADGGYFHFRKAHRDLFYFLEAAWVDERSLGTILGKTRRTGATFCADAFALTKGIALRDVNIGMTSKKDSDAKKMFERLTTMFKHMTFFFKPLNTGEGFLKELSFTTPAKKTTKNNQGKENKYDELGTHITFEATTEDSYDSSTMKFYIADEFSKWKTGNILNHWSKVRKTLMKGSRIHGKAFVLSTVEYVTGRDGDDDDAKSGDRFKWLYYQSDPSDRNSNGMTPEGLYKIFIPATDNYEGHIDLYGNCIAETPPEPVIGIDGKLIHIGARQYLDEQLEKYKGNPAKYNDEKRKDPVTEDEMFRVAAEKALFNTVKIQDQMEFNDRKYAATKDRGYKTGNFRWMDETQTRVEFVESPTGRFQINWEPPMEMRNAHEMKGNRMTPKFDFLGCIGIDPYKVNQTQDKRSSKGAISGWLDEHPVEGIPKNQFFMLYNNRPQSLDIFFEDAIMCMVYYSMSAAIERNVDELLKVMHRRGFTAYAMRDPDKMKLTLDEAMYGGFNASDPGKIEKQAQFLEKAIEDHVGVADKRTYREIGEMGECPFNEMLSDFLRFNVLNRTKSDITVAACLAVYGSKKFMLKNMGKRTERFDASLYYKIQRPNNK
jgi:hypothetical protein